MDSGEGRFAASAMAGWRPNRENSAPFPRRSPPVPTHPGACGVRFGGSTLRLAEGPDMEPRVWAQEAQEGLRKGRKAAHGPLRPPSAGAITCGSDAQYEGA
jgi:hypothetical protein